MAALDPIIAEFLEETREGLAQLDTDLVTLETGTPDPDGLERVFRVVHTIKGTSGFLGFPTLERLTHAGENLLSLVRDGEITCGPGSVGALLALVDAIRAIAARIAEDGSEGDPDVAELIERLDAAAEGRDRPERRRRTAKRKGGAKSRPRKSGGARRPDAARAEPGTPAPAPADAALRVKVGLLDDLMTSVGELVLARNQLLQSARENADAALVRACQRLNLVVSELQQQVMKTRLQPVDTLWRQYPRLVRDLATPSAKHVTVSMDGGGTELDKAIIEAIRDPLTHLVRNCVDHGIEPPDVRERAGKPRTGHLILRAYHEGDLVNIEVSDDGAGVDPERIRARAVERGLVTPDAAAGLGEVELTGFLFQPGFSTAEAVTHVSGRGVGMDVVKTNIEQIGGTVELTSTPGAGTTFRLKIPLTLAIIPALIASCAGERYAIPQVNLRESIGLGDAHGSQRLEELPGGLVYRLRGQLLPVVDLKHELGLTALARDHEELATSSQLLVLQADNRRFGVLVEALHDTQEIVVKPLGGVLRDLPMFAGSTILGDGRVALILDAVGLAKRAGLTGETVRQDAIEDAAPAPQPGPARVRLVLCTSDGGQRLAIPLGLVARLERLPDDAIERVGDRPVVQFRGAVLPLLWPGAGAGPAEPRERARKMVVCRAADGSAAVAVSDILEIVEVPDAALRRGADAAPHVVIDGRVTELIDVEQAIRALPAQARGPCAIGGAAV